MEINLDFDGTCVSHEFPKIGNDIGAIPILKRLVNEGHRLILFTMRSDNLPTKEDLGIKSMYGIPNPALSNFPKDPNIINTRGNYLSEAVNWFKENDIPLYGIQTNPTQHEWTKSPKSYAPLMIDDSALGCPLKIDKTISDRPFVDWEKVEEYLIKNNILK